MIDKRSHAYTQRRSNSPVTEVGRVQRGQSKFLAHPLRPPGALSCGLCGLLAVLDRCRISIRVPEVHPVPL